jgi:acetylornithine deacetylase/succinyl-diaminopimelate desuccinylase-like protein
MAQDEPPVVPNVEQELRVVRDVLSSTALESALGYVERAREETLQEFIGVCNAHGPSQDEMYRSRHLLKLLQIYGLQKVHIDDEKNVIGIRPGSGDGPTVVINAHHDNIARAPKDQPIEAFIADERVWCPAASDDLIGVTQVLTILRALNAADVETDGDLWFVFFTNEEPLTNQASPGAGFFVQSNYPLNIDWRNGDILLQLHGGGGEGVTTGVTDMRHRPMLRVFAPVDMSEWGPWHAVDVLGKILSRITSEVRDPRVHQVSRGAAEPRPVDLLYMNPSQIEASETLNGVAYEASVRFDMHTSTEERLWQAHAQITDIAEEVCAEFGDGCEYHYTVLNKNGAAGDFGIPGWDRVQNAPARMAAAAAEALYGDPGVIIPTRGCGDCVRAYRNGMPAMSLRGSVVDHGGGNVETGAVPLQSEVRRVTANHTLTGSVAIDRIWAGVKHGLLFAVSYAGIASR